MSTLEATTTHAETEAPVEESAVWDFLHEMPSWGISLLVHAAVFILLASLHFATEEIAEVELISEITPPEIRQEEYVIDSEVSEEIGTRSDLNIMSPSMATAQVKGYDNHREQPDQRLEERIINPRLTMYETLPTPTEAEAVEQVSMVGTTEYPGGTAGSIDRITQEIAANVRQGRTIVVWLFDESLSLEKRREQIANRFESIYGQLGVLDIGAEEALTTGIIGFGKDVHVLQPEPISDVPELVKKVRSIQNDESGRENVFAAVDRALKTYLPIKRKTRARLMMIIVTDERGDDYAGSLERLVSACAREDVRTYCIGNAAVFGRQKGYVAYTWEHEGETFTEDIEVDQGPETIEAEGLKLPFWTTKARNVDRMSAGYGPYPLARLCAETGGIYFIAEDSARSGFDPAVMRAYTPDYRPSAVYLQEARRNSAKAALLQAASLNIDDTNNDGLTTSEDIPLPQRRFRADNDNILKQQITDAQKPLALLDYYLESIQSALEAGERDRDKMDTDRWRASFDLALGRVLAMRVRAYGYNVMLAEMKSAPKTFSQQGSNSWELVPSANVDSGATVRRYEKKAMELLTRVIDDHPGTPWAYLAQVELSDPLGWEWKEVTQQLPSMNNGGNNGNRPQFAPEEERRRQMARERSRKRNESRPKL